MVNGIYSPPLDFPCFEPSVYPETFLHISKAKRQKYIFALIKLDQDFEKSLLDTECKWGLKDGSS